MNTDELKMVLDLVATVSGDAKSVAIWYFIAKYGINLFANLIIAFCVIWVVKIVAGSFTRASEWAEYGRSVARTWGGHGGEYIYDTDKIAIHKSIKAAPEMKK